MKTENSKPKNKGLQIRDYKRKKKNAKMREEKLEQKNLCRFVDFNYRVFSKINGKTRMTGSKKGFGLQVGNKIYMNDGHYKFANNKNLHIEHIYTEIPEQAEVELIKKYNEIKG